MDIGKEIFEQIEKLCLSVTAETYESRVWQGREKLLLLHELGWEQAEAYPILLSYSNRFEDGLAQDCLADILDFAAGWCSPQNAVWEPADSSL